MHDLHLDIFIPVISLGLIIMLTCVNVRYFLESRKQYKLIKKEKERLAQNLRTLATSPLPVEFREKVKTVKIQKLPLMRKAAVKKEILFQHWPSDN